jgi:sugar phosphate isomerase/epimerase
VLRIQLLFGEKPEFQRENAKIPKWQFLLFNNLPGVHMEIYLATVALEKNRWGSKVPSIQISEWIPRIAEAGFDGIELWENHCESVSETERQAIKKIPVKIFNSYCSFTEVGAPDRTRASLSSGFYGCGGMKWNVGNEVDRREEYLRNASAMAAKLPRGFRFSCECHPGTILETPPQAKAFLDDLAAPTEKGGAAIRAIIHPLSGLIEISDWFDALGDRIDHAHIQMRNAENKFIALADDEAKVKKQLSYMKSRGFRGTWSIEFVKGTGLPDETPEGLFKQACDDRKLLASLWKAI